MDETYINFISSISVIEDCNIINFKNWKINTHIGLLTASTGINLTNELNNLKK